MRNSFTFYRSFMEGMESIEAESFKRLMLAMMHYALDDLEPQLDGLEYALFMAWKANIDASNRRKENGLKGGRPKTETAEIKTEQNRTEPNLTETESLYKDKREIKREIKEKDKEKEKRFVRPTVEEVDAYCRERGNNVNAQSFIDFYESKGWKVGNSPMKDWKACVRTWEGRNKKVARSGTFQIESRKYDMDALEKELTNAVDYRGR